MVRTTTETPVSQREECSEEHPDFIADFNLLNGSNTIGEKWIWAYRKAQNSYVVKCQQYDFLAESYEALAAKLAHLEHLRSGQMAVIRCLEEARGWQAQEVARLQKENEQLKESAKIDYNNLYEASQKAGIVWFGCDTPDLLAEEILGLKEMLKEKDTKLTAIRKILGEKNEELAKLMADNTLQAGHIVDLRAELTALRAKQPARESYVDDRQCCLRPYDGIVEAHAKEQARYAVEPSEVAP